MKRFFKIKKAEVLVGLFMCNSPEIIEMQLKLFEDMEVKEIDENEYRNLQENASWNNT